MNKKEIKVPVVNLLSIVTGIAAATLLAVYTDNDYLILGGAELAIYGLIGLLVTGRLKFLSKTLIALGILMPLFFIIQIPLFYQWFSLENAIEAGLLGAFAGFPLLLGGYFMHQYIKKRKKDIPPEDYRLNRLIRIGMLLLVVSIGTGIWSDITLALSGLGVAILVLTLILYLKRNLSLTRQQASIIIFALIVVVVISITGFSSVSGGRINFKESLVGLVPAGIIAIIGYYLISKSNE